MKKRILLLEYLNYVDSNGYCIGHGQKALSEAIELIEDYFDITVACSKPYMPASNLNFDYLELNSCKENARKCEIYKTIINNCIETSKNKSDLIWFTNVEWLGISLIPFIFHNKSVIATVYRDYVDDIMRTNSKFKVIKANAVEKGLMSSKLIVSTQIKSNISTNQIHLPDYIYDEEKYEKYNAPKKQNWIICVGSMRRSKDLIGLVKHFNNTSVRLLIIGEFIDIDYYFEVRNEIESTNIVLENRKLEEEEYYRIIGSSRFVILPYVMNQYITATSGILQESIFLGAVPIAPKQLLHNNHINGIGYTAIEDIPIDINKLDYLTIGVENNLDYFRKSKVKATLIKALNEIT